MSPKEDVDYQLGYRHLCGTCLKAGIMNPTNFLWNGIVLFVNISCENIPFLKGFFFNLSLLLSQGGVFCYFW